MLAIWVVAWKRAKVSPGDFAGVGTYGVMNKYAEERMDDLSVQQYQKLNEICQKIRQEVLEVYTTAGGGHFGGSLSVVEILVTLYSNVLRFDPGRPHWDSRDRVILSKGHAAGALCPVLAHFGFFEQESLETFNKLDSPYGMHPDMHKIPGCDMSSGSLGHGLAVGCGMALAGKADRKDYRVYVLMGDGECQEGTVWEAAMVASHNRLSNLTAVVDRNMVSLDGKTEDINSLEPFAGRWRSFGWRVIEADGHNPRELTAAYRQAIQAGSAPCVIIARTVKGKGVSFMEGGYEYHYASLKGDSLERARAELRKEMS